MEIIDNSMMPDFVYFHKKVLVLLFNVWNFNINANKSECIKIRSSNKCLHLMHIKFHGSVAAPSGHMT